VIKVFNFLRKKNHIALFVDGPNVIRKDVNINLNEVKKELEKYGEIRIAKMYLDQYASDKLIEAMVNQGYDIVITTGDVDVTMAIEAITYVFDKNIDIIALLTRDTDYRPVLVKAREFGKKTIVIGNEPGFSIALRNSADISIVLKPSENKGFIHHAYKSKNIKKGRK